MNKFELIIGIEIHIELNTKSKMFSTSANDFGARPNTAVSVLDLGYPGTLPVVNQAAVIKAIKLAKALKMTIANELHFDRKNYFYPDLPKGYQITQQFQPIGQNGTLTIETEDSKPQVIKIERIHLEEDTAKQVHRGAVTQLNYNRAGVPLIEVVTQPEITSAAAAVAYVKLIQSIAEATNISDAKMEEGSLRVDVNISHRPAGVMQLGTKVEIKNLNSIKNVQLAIQYEIKRQTNLLMHDQKVAMETRRFDEKTATTVLMRKKTGTLDYKFFPDPNIPIIKLDPAFIAQIEPGELPWDRAKRLKKSAIKPVYIAQLLKNRALLTYFDQFQYHDKNAIAKIIFSEILALANVLKKPIPALEIAPQQIDKMLQLMAKGLLSSRHVKQIIPLLSETNHDIETLIKMHHLQQISDRTILKQHLQAIIDRNGQLVAEFTDRPLKVTKFLLGNLMKVTKGQANPLIANELVVSLLKGLSDGEKT